MKISLTRILFSCAAVALLGLLCYASIGGGAWQTILADDFDDCRIVQNAFAGDVGSFIIDDPGQIIRYESGGTRNGYILFEDQAGDNLDAARLIGVPIKGFIQFQLPLKFDLTSSQENSDFIVFLTDEDGFDVFSVSLGENGHWFVNGVDTLVSYNSFVTYGVSVLIEVDPDTRTAAYTAFVEEAGGGGYYVLDEGMLSNFNFGRKINEVRFEKPLHTPAGTFILDNVLLQCLDIPDGQYQSTQFQR